MFVVTFLGGQFKRLRIPLPFTLRGVLVATDIQVVWHDCTQVFANH